MKHSESTTETAAAPVGTAAAGVARRRLLRAGLAAAPVMAALKSNTVLAGEHSCVRPSSFASLTAAHMKVSQGRVLRTDYSCRSHGYWKNHDAGLPQGFKTDTPFVSGITGFVANPGGAFSGLSLQAVLDQGSNENNAALARHVTAAFLSATSVSNDPSAVWLTQGQCAEIWNGQGVWSPFAGTTWTLTQTMAYFEVVYGPKFV